MGNGILNHIY